MKRNTTALTLLLCIVTLVVMSATAYASDFPTFQHDNYHSGITNDDAPITSTNLTYWATNVGTGGWAGFDTAPVVGGDKVFGIYYNGSVFAFNKTTGNVVWHNTQIGGDGAFELATPAYNDGVLYVALSKGNASTTTGIHVLWANNGSVKWTTPNITDEQTNTPVVYDNGYVYFGTVNMTGVNNSDKGTYYCYNASNGNQVWKRNTTTGGGYYGAGAAVIGDYLVYPDDKSYLVSVYKNNGTLVPSQSLNVSSTYGVTANEIRSSVTYSATTGRIYFTSKGGYCYALGFNANNGTFNTGDKWCTSLGAQSTSTPAVYNGQVYVGQSKSGSYGFRILQESNGTVLYSTPTDGDVQSSPVLSVDPTTGDCYAYFTANTGTGDCIYCVESNGRISWSDQPTGSTYTLQGVAISDGYVYFGNDNGYMYGYHLK